MRRLLLIPLALLGLATAGALASIKQANASFTGTITSLTAKSVTVETKNRHLTCSVTAYSPATTQFAAGDRVKIACANHVLVAIGDVVTPTSEGQRPSASSSPTTSGFSGAIVALNSTSITVHDGDRTLTCSMGVGSPSASAFHLGDHAKIGCANGLLISIGAPGGTPPTTTGSTTTSASVTNANGPIGALDSASLSVQTMTCSIGAGSPSVGTFHVGDSVRMTCVNGRLFELKHNDAPPPPPVTTTTVPATTTTTTTTTTAYENSAAISGTITALSASAITVHSNDSSLICTLSPSTPTSGFAVGNAVRMYCVNGALYQLVHSDAPPPTTTTTTTPTTTTQQVITGITGTIGTLATSSITAIGGGDDGHASLTCTLGQGTPSLAGFSVGSLVRMYCLSGALYQLKHNDPVPPPVTTTPLTTTTTQQDSTTRTGTVSAAGSSSITVANGDGSLTCAITQVSPSTTAFPVATSARIYCLNGALVAITHP
ncbi:MAG TPA: hypothetical protein VGM80_05055 [Gaiellaceae bacterium]